MDILFLKASMTIPIILIRSPSSLVHCHILYDEVEPYNHKLFFRAHLCNTAPLMKWIYELFGVLSA